MCVNGYRTTVGFRRKGPREMSKVSPQHLPNMDAMGKGKA